jgi:hypothetical protein
MQIGSDSSVAPVSAVSGVSYGAEQTSRTASAPQSAAAENSLNSAAQETLAAVYFTTAAGKNYSANVEEAGAEYIASIPYPPGGSVSGPTVEAAENNLSLRIDELV